MERMKVKKMNKVERKNKGEKRMENVVNKNKGITLIALVITIALNC